MLLKKEKSIKYRNDFVKIISSGKRVEDRYFKIVYSNNSLGSIRMSTILGKRIGKANKRNKIRRRIREIFRHNYCLFPNSVDILIFPKKGCVNKDYHSLKITLINLIKNIKI